MISEPFAIGRSPIHRLDPRIRLAAAAVFSCVVALCREFPALLAALIISLALVRRLLVVNGLVAFIWLVIPFTFPGEALFHLGPFGVAREGISLAAQITLKSNAIVLAFMALAATMSIATVGHALNRLRVPDKIVHLFLMTYRYVFVLEQEYHRLVRAACIRGFQPGTNLHTYRTYAYLVGMLFVRAVERAERVRWAMLCRGFKRKFYCLQEFKAGPGSLFFLILMSAAVLVVAALEIRTVSW
jgi:cobalt/nickel transport system permease protein